MSFAAMLDVSGSAQTSVALQGIPDPALDGGDYSQASVILAVTTPLLAVGMILFLLRIYSRIQSVRHNRYRLWWDDIFLILAVIFSLISYAFLFPSIRSGYGQHIFYLSDEEQRNVRFWITISLPFWFWGSTFVKISLGYKLMRFKNSHIWRTGLIIFSCVLPTIVAALWVPIFTKCYPWRATWDPRVQSPICLDVIFVRRYTFALSATFIFADLILTIIPLTFVLGHSRPLKEKFIVGFLMSLGAIATASQVAVLVFKILSSHEMDVDYTYTAPRIAVVGSVEVWISIIAACSPTIKLTLERIMTGHALPVPVVTRGLSKRSEPARSKEVRFTRDLGLDALPDNVPIPHARARFNWRNWSREHIPGLSGGERDSTLHENQTESRWSTFMQSLSYTRNSSVVSRASNNQGGRSGRFYGFTSEGKRSKSVTEGRSKLHHPISDAPPMPPIPPDMAMTGVQEEWDPANYLEPQHQYENRRWRLHRGSAMNV